MLVFSLSLTVKSPASSYPWIVGTTALIEEYKQALFRNINTNANVQTSEETLVHPAIQ